jgi:hypothetical protein
MVAYRDIVHRKEQLICRGLVEPATLQQRAPKYDSKHLSLKSPGRGQSAFGINSVSPKTGFREKESASDAQQSTCEFRLLLRRQLENVIPQVRCERESHINSCLSRPSFLDPNQSDIFNGANLKKCFVRS